MKSPLRFLKSALLVCLTATLSAGAAATSRAQSLQLYSDTPVPSTSSAQTATHFMQLVTLAVPGPGTYTLSGFSIGVNFATGTTLNQNVAIYFYNGVDTSTTSTDALANATDALFDPSTGAATGIFGPLTAQAAAGNFTFSYPQPGNTFPPVTLTLTGTAVAVEVFLLDNSGTNFSTVVRGRFESAPPTVGTSATYVWNDLNDGVFQGSEQTNFGQLTGAYIRLGLNGIPSIPGVPEPGTWAMIAVGLGLMAVVVRRRMA